MTRSRPARSTTRRIRLAGLLALVAAIGGLLGSQSVAPPSSTAASPVAARGGAAAAPGRPRPALRGARKLDPDLAGALRTAVAAAADDGVAFTVRSGWRSPEHQQQLLDEAITEHGSAAEAARWVATPETSPHVSGDAVDLGPLDATAWLSEHGAAYGLCQIYENEPWHYELRPEATDSGCPPMYPDPAHDPRMRG